MEGKALDDAARGGSADVVKPGEAQLEGRAETGAKPNAGVSAAATTPTAAETEEDVPDPDEDDLDDLDDFLDEFSAAKIDSNAPATAQSGPGRPSAASAAPAVPATTAAAATPGQSSAAAGGGGDVDQEEMFSDDEFAKQLEANMADLLGEIENSPDVQAQFETLLKEFGMAADGSAAGNASASSATGSPPPPTPKQATGPAPAAATTSASSSGDASFQETIRRTMERMQASGEQATAAAAADTEGGVDDLLSEFMKQMQAGGGGSGAGNEDELSKMLVGMMEELTNKEILYEPMKELDDKFPAWMAANKATTSAADLERYTEQQLVVKEIVTRFEAPSYSDANPDDREYIVDRMQRMQAAGSPPSDLVGNMPSAQDALAAPDETCNPQ
ncbi:peroxisomal membrane protein receptor [Niveomyces insectorum RCEF 264]|uniref:Peroxisomal membrane protein receptor n=1 Tax=Niveomyces insectorum RCEF 264 TaxID=1081102 RepID=A0A167YRT6_9HYPO|nr:peroxisomal membrane protein receptor [Niveomyces insectorum RCEF 264]